RPGFFCPVVLCLTQKFDADVMTKPSPAAPPPSPLQCPSIIPTPVSLHHPHSSISPPPPVPHPCLHAALARSTSPCRLSQSVEAEAAGLPNAEP
ncbi:hypothetical protein BaRGS_00032961, partial [Batillaria attramentaria]